MKGVKKLWSGYVRIDRKPIDIETVRADDNSTGILTGSIIKCLNPYVEDSMTYAGVLRGHASSLAKA